jgi:hypothetical protein
LRRAVLAILTLILSTQTLSADKVGDIITEARSFCESFDDGRFSEGDAATEIDLDGDGTLDRVVDESKFSCTSMASAFCGSGGCALHAVIGDRSWRFQAEGWRMMEWDDRPILMIARDGVWCGGAGAQLCFEAVVWSDGEMLTVMPAP